MDDMNAFERQVAADVLRTSAPPRPVDDAAIFTAITATQSPKWRFQSMFSATKFVVAGVIVALFGGFLLAGVLTQPSEEAAPAAVSTSGPGTFSPAGSLSRSGHAATLLPDGRVVVFGSTWVDIWDPETASFASAGMLTTSRAYDHEAALLPDGRVLVVGGYGDSTAEVWDPETESSALAGSLPPARQMGSTTILPDGRVLLVGGGLWGDASQKLPVAEIWDPETATSAPAGALLEWRRGHTATVLPDGRVLIVGGVGEEGYLASAEVWDPATLTFSPAGTLTEARGVNVDLEYHTATLLSDGRVLVVGGNGGGFTPPLASAEVWDPATLSFSPAGTLAEGRFQHTASPLPDGRVLVIGGLGRFGEDWTTLASTEIWDPTTESFTEGPSLQEGRYLHTATVLPDGRVIVIGGDALERHIATAEVWEPNAGAPRSDVTEADTTTPELLSGVDLVTEEVEPGVYRVVGDGTDHDLSLDTGDPESTKVVAGQDGSMWVQGRDREDLDLIRLGSDGTVPLGLEDPDISVAPDGTVWAITLGNQVRSSDGLAWTRHPTVPAFISTGIEVASDGEVWVSWVGGASMVEGERLGVSRLADGEWQEQDIGREFTGGTYSDLAVGPDGTVLLGTSDIRRSRVGDWVGVLERHDDGWATAVTVDIDETSHGGVAKIASGPDGTAWVYSWDGVDSSTTRLHRRTDGGWETFGADGSVGILSEPRIYDSSLAVSGDGRLWVAFNFPADVLDHHRQGHGDSRSYLETLNDTGCVGLISFDGSAWAQHLAGTCATHVSAAPDGNVWVTVVEQPGRNLQLDSERLPTGLYVITPEAVADAE